MTRILLPFLACVWVMSLHASPNALATEWGEMETVAVNTVVFEGHTKALLFPKRCSVVLTQNIVRLCGTGTPVSEELKHLFGELIPDPNDPNCAISKNSFYSLELKADLKTQRKAVSNFSYLLRPWEPANPLLEQDDTLTNSEMDDRDLTQVSLAKDESNSPLSFHYQSTDRKSVTCVDLKEASHSDEE